MNQVEAIDDQSNCFFYDWYCLGEYHDVAGIAGEAASLNGKEGLQDMFIGLLNKEIERFKKEFNPGDSLARALMLWSIVL
jgi:hypothetical protein